MGCSGTLTVTSNGMRLPWLPAGPGEGSDSTLLPRQYQYGPDCWPRSLHPPTPIISLYAVQPGNALSAACTATTPPPDLTYCSNDDLRAAGHRSSGAS